MRRPRAVERTTDNAAPIVFGIFTTLGVGFIIVAKTWGASSVLVTTVPVLLMSGYSMDHESELLLAQGAVGFLQKPFTVRELLRMIDETFAYASVNPT